MRRAAVLCLLVAALALAANPLALAGGAATNADVEVYSRDGCPYCASAREFLAELQRERPGLRVVVHDVVADPAALARLVALTERHGDDRPGVPTFVVGDTVIVGFAGGGTTGARLRALLDRRDRGGGAPPAPPPPADTRVEIPLLGAVSVGDVGLPAFTVLLGLVDGFNPCAMWVLLFVLSLLVNVKSRTRMALVGGTFVVTSGVVYFAFMAAWLNLFLLVGVSRTTTIALALVAGVIGALNVKDAVAPGRGPSLAIPAAARPGLYARVRGIVTAGSLGAALGGVVVLAVLVNVVELLCTAGFPAVYTRLLTLRELPGWQYYAYLALYNVAYVADDAAMLAIAVATLSRRKLQEGGGRWLKLLSGGVMLVLAVVLAVG